jgi:hypothetical protein
MTRTPCLAPGCNQILDVPGPRYCPRHNLRSPDRRRSRSGEPWSTTAWRARAKAYRATHPVCERCGSSEQLEVHHVDGNARERLIVDDSKLMTLCHRCHGRAHGELKHADD